MRWATVGAHLTAGGMLSGRHLKQAAATAAATGAKFPQGCRHIFYRVSVL